MEFEWDDEKNKANILKHKVSFGRAALIFTGPIYTKVDLRQDYGETRFVSIGIVEDECLVVVHTIRGEKLRVISAWKGGQDERSKLSQLYS
ncbi:MAG: hypothetical protein CFE32_15230 [Alphaproteobacteria bacterium PA3]|nr:MAG: hypothetical protein CFE32_15230 [Alphaproteobacteria bacterium PA3]